MLPLTAPTDSSLRYHRACVLLLCNLRATIKDVSRLLLLLLLVIVPLRLKTNVSRCYESINNLDRSVSRFAPKLFVWIFIPCDIVSLVLQAAGGALSSTQAGTGNKSGVKISMAGLILQVITLVIFVGLFIDYVVRYRRRSAAGGLQRRVKIFLGFLFLSIIFILIRCIYRVDELQDGYDGPLIRNEPLFMILEAA